MFAYRSVTASAKHSSLQTCGDVSVLRLEELQAQREEGRRLEHPPLELLQADGRVQELPLLLVREVRVDELVRVRQEVEVIEPAGARDGDGVKVQTRGSFLCSDSSRRIFLLGCLCSHGNKCKQSP